MHRSLFVSPTSARKHCDPCYQLMKISEIQGASPSMVSMYYLRQLHPMLQDCEHLAIEIEGECEDRRWARAEVVAPSVADGRAIMWKIGVDRDSGGSTRKYEISCCNSFTNRHWTMLNVAWEMRDLNSINGSVSLLQKVLEKWSLEKWGTTVSTISPVLFWPLPGHLIPNPPFSGISQ